MRKYTIAVVALAAVAALALPATGGAAGGTVSRSDQQWLAGAMQTDLFEIQAGETATMEGQSKGAVKLGEMLSKAHAALYADGKKLGAKIAKGSNLMVKAAARSDLKMYAMHLRLARMLPAEL